jgi:hypothetical protein
VDYLTRGQPQVRGLARIRAEIEELAERRLGRTRHPDRWTETTAPGTEHGLLRASNEGSRLDLASPLGQRGPLASLNQAKLVGEPALGPDLVTERQTSGMAVSIGAHIECFPSPAGRRHSPKVR